LKRVLRTTLAAFLLFTPSLLVAAIPATVTFHFERVGLSVPKFTLMVSEDGTGTYEADQIEIPSHGGTLRSQPAAHVQRAVSVTPATLTKLFALARKAQVFNTECASKAKNIADTGSKALSYAGPDGAGTCAYNYTENKQVAALTELFQGIATTMDEARRLDFIHRYDRLGLDAEMTSFATQVDEGRALELGNILPTLNSIVSDTELIQRVRLRAQKMMESVADFHQGGSVK